jgi:hypothetical protein
MHGAEVDGSGRIGFKLLAQLHDVVVDGPCGRVRGVVPDVGEEFLTGDDAVGVFDEVLEQLNLVCGESDGDSVLGDNHPGEVGRDVSEGDLLGLGRTLGAADGCLDSCHEFAGAKGLGDVVVGSHLEEQDLVGDLGDGAEDDDWGGGGPALDALADLETGETGKHEVENYTCGLKGLAAIEAFDSIGG